MWAMLLSVKSHFANIMWEWNPFPNKRKTKEVKWMTMMASLGAMESEVNGLGDIRFAG